MIPYEVDPSLHTTEPEEPSLDDGFSRPHASSGAAQRDVKERRPAPPAHNDPFIDPSLAQKSPF